MVWRSFWAAHQRFFRHMCMAAKVPAVVRMASAALAQNKCVVVGLQVSAGQRAPPACLPPCLPACLRAWERRGC